MSGVLFICVIATKRLASGVTCAYRTAGLILAGAGIDNSLPDMIFRADPPDLFCAARRDLLRRQCAIELRMPLSGNGRKLAGQIIVSNQHFTVSTIGTAAILRRPGRHGHAKRVSLFASPPKYTVAVRCHISSCQRLIFLPIPLGCHHGKPRQKVILSRQNGLSRTDRTAPAADPRRHRCTPNMPFFAQPPNFFQCTCQDLFRRDAAVFLRMPLGSEFRMGTGEIGLSRQNGVSGADRAFCARGAGLHSCLPGMAFFTQPPHFSVTSGKQRCGIGVTVILRMPLKHQFRISGCQICHAADRQSIGAIGASCPVGAGIDGCLPAVALFAAPPYLAVAL